MIWSRKQLRYLQLMGCQIDLSKQVSSWEALFLLKNKEKQHTEAERELCKGRAKRSKQGFHIAYILRSFLCCYACFIVIEKIGSLFVAVMLVVYSILFCDYCHLWLKRPNKWGSSKRVNGSLLMLGLLVRMLVN